MPDDDTTTREGPQPFHRFLGQLDDGRAHDELGTELYNMTEAVLTAAHDARGKRKASLTLKLDLIADEDGVVEVFYAVTPKPPKPPPSRRTHFWRGKDGNLTRKHPDQEELPLKDVSRPQGPARDVGRG